MKLAKPLSRLLALGATLSLGSAQLDAHARLDPTKDPKPRDDGSAHKAPPCGTAAKTDDRTTFTAGETTTVHWEETINHPGYFRIAFSPDGATGFDDNVLKDNITDTQDGSVTYTDPNTYHKYSTEITLPNTPCEECSLQLIQWMTEDPANPRPYYSCADIKIVAADDAGDEGDEDDDETSDKPAAPENLEVKFIKPTAKGD
jgi:hypothetical protein